MFEQLLHESCRLLTRSRSLFWRFLRLGGPRPKIDPRWQGIEALHKHYQILLGSGEIVWGRIVQANYQLFQPGQQDLPANTIYSPEPYFANRPGHLGEIAYRIFDLKGTEPDDPDLDPVAATITDEFNGITKAILPAKITDGHEVYLAGTQIHRACLPDGMLSDRLFPLLICPRKTPANLMLPLPYWGQALTRYWGELEELIEKTSAAPEKIKKPLPREYPLPQPKQLHGRPSELVTVTDVAARKIHSLARECQLGEPYYVSVRAVRREDGMGYNHAVDLAPSPDEDREDCFESNGIRILVEREQIELLRGTVVDFQDSLIYGQGFVVRNPNV